MTMQDEADFLEPGGELDPNLPRTLQGILLALSGANRRRRYSVAIARVFPFRGCACRLVQLLPLFKVEFD
jgi:hypothetical protein